MSSDSESSTLHMVCACPQLRWPQGLLAMLAPGDGVVLMQDAVWMSVAVDAEPWPARFSGIEVLVLEDDLRARGLMDRALHSGFRSADDGAWVAASERHRRSLQWGSGR